MKRKLVFTFIWPACVLLPWGLIDVTAWLFRNGLSLTFLIIPFAIIMAIAGYMFDGWRPK